MSPQFSRSLPGLVLILLGAGFLLDSLNILNFGFVVAHWWPVIIIAVGLLGIQNGGNRAVSLVVIGIGLLLLMRTLNVLGVSLGSLFWPLILIAVGASMIGGSRRHEGVAASKDDELGVNVLFGGVERKVGAKEFKGGTVNAMFGGAELDLRESGFADGASIHVTAAFGGVEIKVPKDCKVVWKGVPLFGGFSDETEHVADAKHTLTIDGMVVFGGVSVKN